MNMGIKGDKLMRKLRAVRFVVLDFDGTMTDGFVYQDQDGRESVRCSRKDSLGIGMLKNDDIGVMVLSKETNPVVKARCRKMKIPCRQAEDNKASFLQEFFDGRFQELLYMGDDINDLECLKLAGVAVTVADGHPMCRSVADYVTNARGGDHAVREMCDLLLEARKE